MKTIIINNVDRQDVSLYFNNTKTLTFNNEVVFEKYKELFHKNLEFQLFFSEKHTLKYNFFKNCKVIDFNSNSIYFTNENIVDGLTEKNILPLIRKQKLKTINENT